MVLDSIRRRMCRKCLRVASHTLHISGILSCPFTRCSLCNTIETSPLVEHIVCTSKLERRDEYENVCKRMLREDYEGR